MNGWLIRLIVVKKVLVASVLLLVSVAATFSSMDMQRLARQAELWADADRRILVRLAQQGLDLDPEALRAFAVVTGMDALLEYLAAWATFTERPWGYWLLVGLLRCRCHSRSEISFMNKAPVTCWCWGSRSWV